MQEPTAIIPRPGVTGSPMARTPRPLREPRGLTPPLRLRRAVTLIVLTLLVPGSAQLAAGNRRVGRAAVRCWLGVLVAAGLAALLWLLLRPLLLALATNPLLLSLAAVALHVAAVAWAALVLDALVFAAEAEVRWLDHCEARLVRSRNGVSR